MENFRSCLYYLKLNAGDFTTKWEACELSRKVPQRGLIKWFDTDGNRALMRKKKDQTYFKRNHFFRLCFSENVSQTFIFLSFFFIFFLTENGIKRREKMNQQTSEVRKNKRKPSMQPILFSVEQAEQAGRLCGEKCTDGGRRRGRGPHFGMQLRGSSCWISTVAMAAPGATTCPIDFSSATNWTIFHGVMLRATACLFSYPAVDHAMCPVWGVQLTTSTGLDLLFKISRNAGEK